MKYIFRHVRKKYCISNEHGLILFFVQEGNYYFTNNLLMIRFNETSITPG